MQSWLLLVEVILDCVHVVVKLLFVGVLLVELFAYPLVVVVSNSCVVLCAVKSSVVAEKAW